MHGLERDDLPRDIVILLPRFFARLFLRDHAAAKPLTSNAACFDVSVIAPIVFEIIKETQIITLTGLRHRSARARRAAKRDNRSKNHQTKKSPLMGTYKCHFSLKACILFHLADKSGHERADSS